MRGVFGHIVRWVVGALGVLAVTAGALWLYAMRQPRAMVTTDEVIPPGEQAIILRLVRAATDSLDERAKDDRLYKRDAHAKPHGCVTATLTVDPTLAPRYRQGIFAEPGRVWKAWVRFSNGTQSDDRKPDARGMAVKVMNVPGEKLLSPADEPEQTTQDFVMVDYPTFFLRDVAEYERFFAYQQHEQPVRYFFAGWPWQWKLHAFYHGSHMLFHHVPSPLATGYFSMSAYRFGPENVKFGVRPCRHRRFAAPSPRTDHYLRDALVRDLRASGACFDFVVQVQDPTKNMPIEDPTIAWDERDSPYVPIARLHIPAQEFSTDVQNRFCEALSFAPWHGLPAHRPVGALNRVRRAVYLAVSQRRHARNDERRREPRGWCLDLSGAPCEEQGP